MKICYCIAVFVMVFASITFGQEKAGPDIYVNTGLAIPSSPDGFSDYWNTGLNFGFAIGFPISPSVAFLPSLSYSRFGLNGNKLLSDYGYGGYGIEVTGGNASIITVYADFKASLGPPVNQVVPYLVGGAGFFRVSTNEATISYQGMSEILQGDDESKLGLNFGAGIDIFLNPKTSLFFAIKYVIGFTESESTQYFPLLAGLSFK